MEVNFSKQTLQRLPIYYDFLKRLDSENISATSIASALGLNDVQVRKDLASVSNKGRPKIGYKTSELIGDIKTAVEVCTDVRFAIAGLGHLGLSLIKHSGFAQYGIKITTAFDNIHESNISSIENIPVYPLDSIESVCVENDIHVGIIAVGDNQAAEVCERLINAGVSAIWNFTGIHLSAPEGVIIHNENIGASLALLSRHLETNVYNKNLSNAKGD